MGKALYRSYRSKSLDEVVGQDHITKTLGNSLSHGTYVHAYLLTGPRGVGKTSIARILAHEVNKVKYSDESPYVDIIEIDAASNRRIDEIRELRERVVIAPTELKYKVYIIDEVHMLTKEAFNALLKTLEEPPVHAIFILATTDIHKVPETIVSRCVRFNFKPIDPKDISLHLNKIAKKEKIKISKDALDVIAQNSEGSFRDAIALLDQIQRKDEEIDASEVIGALGLAGADQIQSILQSVKDGNIKSILNDLDSIYGEGANERKIARQLIASIRDEVVKETDNNTGEMIALAEDILEASASNDAKTAIELALVRTAASNRKAETGNFTPEKPANFSSEIQQEKNDVRRENNKVHKRNNQNDQWINVLNELKEKNRSLYSIARIAEVTKNDDNMALTFNFSFHLKQAKQSKNKKLLEDIIKKNYIGVNTIVFEQSSSTESQQGNTDDDINNISNIFGSSEVLES